MKIVSMIPLFREPINWIVSAIKNASIYANDIVICVNDSYDEELKKFLLNLTGVRKVAFINKIVFEDSIIDTSLLTMAQELNPDWIVKHDIDEEFEDRVVLIRKILEKTDFDVLSVLWPSYVKDEKMICHYIHTQGATKRVFFRFDLNRLYIPGKLHASISMHHAREAVVALNLYHKNLIKTDQENYIKFVVSGREMAKDGCVTNLRSQIPQVLQEGRNMTKKTYIKLEKDSERLLPHSIQNKTIDPNIMPEVIPLKQFNVFVYKDIIRKMYL